MYGRLYLGVGRGAFPFEMERMGVPMAEHASVLTKALTFFRHC